jgi:hypothetical protein
MGQALRAAYLLCCIDKVDVPHLMKQGSPGPELQGREVRKEP